ncbi:hypothetical protein MRX96_012203 [Rhipicephalus microplus]
MLTQRCGGATLSREAAVAAGRGSGCRCYSQCGRCDGGGTSRETNSPARAMMTLTPGREGHAAVLAGRLQWRESSATRARSRGDLVLFPPGPTSPGVPRGSPVASKRANTPCPFTVKALALPFFAAFRCPTPSSFPFSAISCPPRSPLLEPGK